MPVKTDKSYRLVVGILGAAKIPLSDGEDNMIDLKAMYEKYPDSFSGKNIFKGYLNDLYPDERARVNILTCMFAEGAKELAEQSDVMAHERFCRKICGDYGFSEKLVAECFSLFTVCFGTDDQGKGKLNSDGQPKKKRKESANAAKASKKPLKASPSEDFDIENGILKKYKGKGGDVVIPDGVTRIGNFAFSGCSSLTSINIPDSVTSIGERAFSGCSSLTSINIPDSVTEIGIGAFSDCNELTSAVIPDGVKSIKPITFERCGKLAHITIPSGVTEIGDGAFEYCVRLKNVTIPGGVMRIGENAFHACRKLQSITIPKSVERIGKDAFCDCCGLESISVENGNEIYCGKQNCLIHKISKTLVLGCKNSVIPADGSVTEIGTGAFRYCSGLRSIVVPYGVTTIGKVAFERCSGLTSVVFSESVTKILKSAFSDCSGLTSVTIPSGVTEIGIFAFFGCGNLISATFKNPYGWKCYDYSFSYEEISPAALFSSVLAASCLKNRYCECEWECG